MERLTERLAIRLTRQNTPGKSLVNLPSRQQMATRWAVALKLFWVVALTWSAHASAVGMGGINVTSALGQPLKAEIELVVTGKAEKASLVARLASPEDYKKAGLDYLFNNKVKLQVSNRADGEVYLQVSSAQPINDPYVNLLVELSWSSGKLLREYTFLLDPPGYSADQPKPPEVEVVAPVAPPTLTEKPLVPAAPAPADEETIQDIPFTNTLEPETSAPAQPDETPAAKTMSTDSIVIQHGDTLNKIAAQNKPDEVSLEQMLVALYRANAEQFDGKNMNRIRVGKILRVPDQSEMMAVSPSDAKKEIHAQVKDWNAYRQKLAGAAPVSSQAETAQQTSSGKITSNVADKAPVVKESAKEVLKLSKGDEANDKVAAGKAMSAQDKQNAAQEDAIAKSKATKEAEMRAGLLEKNVQDLKHLAELKSQMAAMTQAVSAVANTSEVASAGAAKPVPVVQPKVKPKQVVAEPSLIDQLLAEPLYLEGAAAILCLGGLGFALNRRKKTLPKMRPQPQADMDEDTGHLTIPVAPSPDTGDFTAGNASKPEMAALTNDVDPISEAELFLSFGREAQAEEILKEALQNTPDNHQIALKLLGIYASRANVNDFSTVARQLKASGDDDAWQKAAAMGRKLEPNNPIYGSAATIEDAGSATVRTAALNPTTDFVLDAPEASNAATKVDFDIAPEPAAEVMKSGTESTMILTTEELAAARSMEMDFDVSTTGTSISAIADAATMDFNFSTPEPAAIKSRGAEKTMILSAEEMAAARSMEMDFDVSTTGTSISAIADAATMDFNFSTPEPAAIKSTGAEKTMILSAEEMAAARSMEMDFDVSTTGTSISAIAGAATMDFNFSTPEPVKVMKSGAENTMILTTEELAAARSMEMDFDVSTTGTSISAIADAATMDFN